MIYMLGHKILQAFSNFENCLFGATNIVKSIDREKWVYSGFGIALDGTGS